MLILCVFTSYSNLTVSTCPRGFKGGLLFPAAQFAAPLLPAGPSAWGAAARVWPTCPVRSPCQVTYSKQNRITMCGHTVLVAAHRNPPIGLYVTVGAVRALFVVPGGRRDARLGRPVVLRAVRPEWPTGAPRNVRGQPTFPASPGRSGCACRERPGLLPCQADEWLTSRLRL